MLPEAMTAMTDQMQSDEFVCAACCSSTTMSLHTQLQHYSLDVQCYAQQPLLRTQSTNFQLAVLARNIFHSSLTYRRQLGRQQSLQ
jgi:hypothetical protein